MESVLPYLETLSLAGVAALGAWFIWWKRTIKEEIVEPEVLLINKDLIRIYARITKLETRCDKMDSLVDKKLDDLNAKVTDIIGNLSEVNGQLKILTSVVHKNGTR